MKFVNNYIQAITLGVDDVSLALTLPDGEYRLTVADSATSATRWEIIDATVAAGSAALTRGREDTLPQDWPAGSVIFNALTAGLAVDFSRAWTVVGDTITASRDLSASDAGQYLPVDSASAVVIGVPAQAVIDWPPNCEIHVQQIGDGQVEFDASSVTIITEGALRTRKKGSAVTLKRLAYDVWSLTGSMEAASESSLPDIIGQSFGGGYYIGDVTVADGSGDDGTYAVIMGGAESEAQLAWKTPPSRTAGATSNTNGLANTLAMQASDPTAHHAGMYCLGYNGGGFSDWYMPSEMEMMLSYTNKQQLSALGLVDQNYWVSEQFAFADNDAIYQDHASGSWPKAVQSSIYRVRPVRRILRA